MNDAKRRLVQSWFIKAQHDLAGAHKSSAEPDPVYDIAIYHCQQTAEKAVKGFLVFHDQAFEKTHDVLEIVELAKRFEPRFVEWEKIASTLTPYAYKFRYPDSADLYPSQEEFNDALKDATALYNFALSLVPAETHPQKHK